MSAANDSETGRLRGKSEAMEEKEFQSLRQESYIVRKETKRKERRIRSRPERSDILFVCHCECKRSNLVFEDLHKSVFVFLLGRRKQTDPKKLGKKVKLARGKVDLTQTQLTEKINAKQKSISRYETGASLPSIKTLVKIAGVAGHLLDE